MNRNLKYCYHFFNLCFVLVGMFIWLFFSSNAIAQSAEPKGNDTLREFSNSSVYYDADEITLQKEDESIRAKGNVIFLVGDIFLTCESLFYSKSKMLLVAEGEVKLTRKNESVFASRISIDLMSKEARLESVDLIVDPQPTEEERESPVGFSVAETKFEDARKARISEILSQMSNLRIEYSNLNKRQVSTSLVDEQLILIQKRYAVLLQRYTRIQVQPNEILEKLPEEDRKKLLRRRSAAKIFLDNRAKIQQTQTSLGTVPGYFRLKADVLHQKPNGSYEATKVSVSACRCEGWEPYAWGLSSRFALIEPEQYVTLKGTTIEALAAPVFFTPYFIFPIKSKRQSGFLIPSVYASKSGTVFSQPYFQTLGNSADATITVNDYSLRGVRLDAELRYRLLPESEFYLNQEVLQDRLFKKETNVERTWRWKNTTKFSAPLAIKRVFFKMDSEALSDNRYPSDFSKDSQVQTDLFSKVQPVKRFYQQNFSLEYFGDNFSASLGTQIQRDTFIEDYKRTPSIAPEIKFSVMPQKLFVSPLFFHHETVFQNIATFRGENFLDVQQNVAVRNESGEAIGQKTEGANGKREENEPFVKGRRLFNLSSVVLPMPPNNFVRSYLTSSFTNVHFWFPKSLREKNLAGSQFYFRQQGRIEIPLDSKLEFGDNQGLSSEHSYGGIVTHNFMPYTDISYIPNIVREGYLPQNNQMFFVQDVVVPEQLMTVGWRGGFEVKEQSFERVEEALERNLNVSGKLGEEEIFPLTVKIEDVRKRLNLSEAETLEKMTSESLSKLGETYFTSWALEELQAYEESVSRSEFGGQLVWPSSERYRLTAKRTWNPLSYGVYTTYNFLARKSASEYNRKLNPGERKQQAQFWGEIVGDASVSFAPALLWAVSTNGKWKREWKRFRETTLSTSVGFPLGLQIEAFKTDVYTEDTSVLANYNQQKDLYPLQKEQTFGLNTTLKLTDRIVLNYGKKLNIKPVRTANPDFEQSNIQKISFVGVQDCLDITLQRFKDFADIERMATWSIGLNLRFLGQQRPFDNIAGSLDREIKRFYAKK